MVCKNNRVPNDHLRKDWYKRVKTYFDTPAKAAKRAEKRNLKAKKIAPRPISTLRPLVHCPTVRYNRRLRLGRGFTAAELKAAGIDSSRARFLGIAVDTRRSHLKDENIKQANVDRLKAYVSRIVRVKKGETLPESVNAPELFALPKPSQEVEMRAITAEAKSAELFKEKREKFTNWRKELKEKQLAKYKK